MNYKNKKNNILLKYNWYRRNAAMIAYQSIIDKHDSDAELFMKATEHSNELSSGRCFLYKPTDGEFLRMGEVEKSIEESNFDAEDFMEALYNSADWKELQKFENWDKLCMEYEIGYVVGFIGKNVELYDKNKLNEQFF